MGKHAKPSFVFMESAAEWGAANGVAVSFSYREGAWWASLVRGTAICQFREMHPTPARKVPTSVKLKDGKRQMVKRPEEALEDYQIRLWDALEANFDMAVAAVHRQWRKDRKPVVTRVEREPEFHVA